MPEKKIIFYDLDGTLVRTAEAITYAANNILKHFERAPLSYEVIRKFVGKGLYYLVAQCLQTEEPKVLEQGAEIYRTYYRDHMMDHAKLYEGVLDILNFFQAKVQIVITNKPNPYSDDMLKGLKVRDYFEEVIPGNAEYPRKPNPSSIQALIENHELAQEQAIMIGDSCVDIETANNACIENAIVAHGFSTREELQSCSPDYIVADMKELLDLVRRQGW